MSSVQSEFDILPEVTVFLRGMLLNDVTLLLSADKSTDGKGVGVSECERSCIPTPTPPPTTRPTMPLPLLLME